MYMFCSYVDRPNKIKIKGNIKIIAYFVGRKKNWTKNNLHTKTEDQIVHVQSEKGGSNKNDCHWARQKEAKFFKLHHP